VRPAVWSAGLGAAVVLATGGCGAVYIGARGPDPAARPMQCTQPRGGVSGMHILLAQAVPTASAVPCLRGAVENWIVETFEVRDGRATIRFTYRFGDDETATVEMARSCDTRGAAEVSSEQPGMRRYDREVRRGDVYASERYYVYEEACTWLRFNLTGRGADLRGAELSGALGFVSRESLDRGIRETTDGRLRLDP
jgi:hypothetical protein